MSPSIIRRLEWSGTLARWSPGQDGRQICPICRGWKPGAHDGTRNPENERQYGYTIGHRAGCELSAEVAALPPIAAREGGGVTVEMLNNAIRAVMRGAK